MIAYGQWVYINRFLRNIKNEGNVCVENYSGQRAGQRKGLVLPNGGGYGGSIGVNKGYCESMAVSVVVGECVCKK